MEKNVQLQASRHKAEEVRRTYNVQQNETEWYGIAYESICIRTTRCRCRTEKREEKNNVWTI